MLITLQPLGCLGIQNIIEIESYSCFRVMTLHMSPIDDTFISGSLDKTLRLWDLRSPNCQARNSNSYHYCQRNCNKIRWSNTVCICVQFQSDLHWWHVLKVACPSPLPPLPSLLPTTPSSLPPSLSLPVLHPPFLLPSPFPSSLLTCCHIVFSGPFHIQSHQPLQFIHSFMRLCRGITSRLCHINVVMHCEWLLHTWISLVWLFFSSIDLQGLMHVNGRPVSAFDPEGLIFAAGVDSEVIKLYDLRSFDKVSNKHCCTSLTKASP